ncbi:MAG: hypothetical protein RIT22_2152 [Bacteroidota bacterium]
MDDILIKTTTTFFEHTFGNPPHKIVLSPGRINIIGEHIDYNDGFVLPAAIDKVICFAFEKTNSETSTIVAIDLDESFEINVENPVTLNEVIWTNYFRGILQQIQNKGLIIGNFNCVFSSTIPIGSGLSSSAALECGFLYGLNDLFHLNITPVDLALMGQSAEHWVGINCGIMDQFASVMSKENQVIKIDCRTLEYEYHKADFSDYSLVLFDSNVKHSLFTSAYNQRRQECEQGLAIFAAHFPEVTSFRDATEEQLLSIQDTMSEDVFKRSHYVIKEIRRVTLACEALDRGDILTLGQLLFDTHEGLSKEYEVSCTELDMIVDTLKKEPAVIKGEEEAIKTKLTQMYQATFGIELKTYEVKISNGTSLYTVQ